MNNGAQATPDHELERQICDSAVPKNEREWLAHHKIERLQARIAERENELTKLREAVSESIKLLSMDRPIDPRDVLRAALKGE